MQNVLRDNDKLDSERKRERGSIQSRLTRIENKDQVKDEKKDEKKEDRKRKRSETPPFSRGAGFMDEKKARNEERERRRWEIENWTFWRNNNYFREGPRSEERRKVVVEEEEAPKKSLDQLFKKTVALPPIYYLPLTEEQIAAKEAEKSAKGKERAETTSDRDRPHRVDRNDRGDRPRHRDWALSISCQHSSFPIISIFIITYSREKLSNIPHHQVCVLFVNLIGNILSKSILFQRLFPNYVLFLSSKNAPNWGFFVSKVIYSIVFYSLFFFFLQVCRVFKKWSKFDHEMFYLMIGVF